MEDFKSQLKFIKEIEVKEVLEDAKNQASKLIDEAQTKAEQTKSKEIERVFLNARELEMQELESVRLQTKQKMMKAKFQLVETATAKSLDKLTELATEGDSSYRNSLQRFVVEATGAIAEEEFELIVHPRDLAFVKQRIKQMENEVSEIKRTSVALRISNEPLQSIGGIVVRNRNGEQIFNNTLEARLAKVRQDMLANISEILFSGVSE
jgi:V/A-type H+-transporting ATPase subunit E